VEHRAGRGADPVPDLLVVVDVLTGHDLSYGDARQRLARGDLSGHANPRDQHVEVGLVRDVRGIDHRLGRGTGGGERDAAPAPHVDGADERSNRSLGGWAELGKRRRPRDGTELQIRCGATAAATGEASGLGAERRHRPAPLPPPELQVLRGDLLPEVSCGRRPPARQAHRVVLQADTHGRGIDDHQDAVRAQLVGRADPRQHQQLRRLHRPAGDDDLTGRAGFARRPVTDVANPRRPFAVEEQLADVRVGSPR
jgi:hypothetical protein